jgi:hypothetical protein
LPFQQRLAAQLNKTFWALIRQPLHAAAATSGKDYGSHEFHIDMLGGLATGYP